ncbi:MAG: GGDEF domain-containing protein [Lachnospiraceae bacterium]|nr:GGDEF domain-containing protein [Lachnospiraceae bacterium]
MICKNIAVLMTGLDSDAQAETLKGIEEYGKNKGFNMVNFVWFTGANEKDKHNTGEINITKLPDFNLFDGIIVFANAMHGHGNRKFIEDILADVSCSVVGVGCNPNGSPGVFSDCYTAMKNVVEYFIVEHNMTKIHFVKGVEGNPDGEARFRGYVDALKEHGIPYDEERVSHGDFYVTGAELAVNEILNSDLEFPEAIVCANDIMALTVCDLLTDRGYKIPEDVAVSGYDYTNEGRFHNPTLMTVKSDFVELGRKACATLVDMIEGKTVEHEVLLPDEMVLAESCGCKDEDIVPLTEQTKLRFSADITYRRMLHQIIILEKDILEGEGFENWLEAMKNFIRIIDPPEFYCCLNDNFFESISDSDALSQQELSVEEMLEFSEESKVVLAYKDKKFRNKPNFKSKYVLDNIFKDGKEPKSYIVSGIHFQEREFGYFVFVDSSYPITNPMFIHFMINMGHAFENIRKQSLIKNVLSNMDELYIRDSLTGAYNRFGMQRFFADIKKKCIMSKLHMQLSFIDLDNLKKINDEFGHDEGDRIINQAAKILMDNAGKFYVVRYGGDEFIVLGNVKTQKEIESYWSKVEKDVEQYNSKSRRKAELSFTVGYKMFELGPETTLEECISVADNLMYDKKKAKKSIESKG